MSTIRVQIGQTDAQEPPATSKPMRWWYGRDRQHPEHGVQWRTFVQRSP